jgi:hypothetical protein
MNVGEQVLFGGEDDGTSPMQPQVVGVLGMWLWREM